MPELPEVEIARRQLTRWLHGRRVLRGEAEKTRIFRGADPKRFEALEGRLAEELFAEGPEEFLLIAVQPASEIAIATQK